MIVDWTRLARRLADRLAAEHIFTDPAWLEIFATTPRHMFVPSFYAFDEYNSPSDFIDGTGDRRQQWLAAVYSDQALVTQYRVVDVTDDGRELRSATSSASMPSVVAGMVEAANITDGHRVLEIGTGTGYNAALLCKRLGEEKVASVDIDPQLIESARGSLIEAGFRPTLAVRDGADGLSEVAPFDRIIATCSIDRIPPAWIDQLAPKGRIVAPLGTVGGALAWLDKTTDDEVVGHVNTTRVYFMPMRAEAADPRGPLDFYGGSRLGDPIVTYEGTTIANPVDVLDADFRLWLELHMSPLEVTGDYTDHGEIEATVVYTPTGWARASHKNLGGGRWPVRQSGRHRPWDTVEVAWRTWKDLHKPDRTRSGISALNKPDRQYAWLDDPKSSYCWPLPLGRGERP